MSSNLNYTLESTQSIHSDTMGSNPPSNSQTASILCNSQPDSPTIVYQSFPIDVTKSRLESKIVNRRDKEELIDNNILPPENIPPSYFPIVKKLELQQTKDRLVQQLRQRPEAADLMNRGIMHDTQARKNVASELEQKLLQRSGRLELMKRGYFEPPNKPKKFTFHSYDIDPKTGKLQKKVVGKDNEGVGSTSQNSEISTSILSAFTGNSEQNYSKKQKITLSSERHLELIKQNEEFVTKYEDKIAGRYVENNWLGSGYVYTGEQNQGNFSRTSNELRSADGSNSSKNISGSSKKKDPIPSPPGPPPSHIRRDGNSLIGKRKNSRLTNDIREIREFTKEYLCKETYEHLKRHCSYRKLGVKGTKDILIERLINWNLNTQDIHLDENGQNVYITENQKLKEEIALLKKQLEAQNAAKAAQDAANAMQEAQNLRQIEETTMGSPIPDQHNNSTPQYTPRNKNAQSVSTTSTNTNQTDPSTPTTPQNSNLHFSANPIIPYNYVSNNNL